MAHETPPKAEIASPSLAIDAIDSPDSLDAPNPAKTKARIRERESASAKRRCVSTACVACRKRKSKCDGNTPSCAACSSVYGTECVYDPNSDHRRKGVYKKDIDNLKTRNSTLQTLIQAILNYPEHEVPELIRQIRTCESLDDVAESILARGHGLEEEEEPESPITENGSLTGIPRFEKELSGKIGQLRLENGSVSFVGGTSNLIFLGSSTDGSQFMASSAEQYQQQADPITSWTEVTNDPELIVHLINLYFTYHYTYFTTLSKGLFYRDFLLGKPPSENNRKYEYCTPLLVNAILALGCHFTSWPAARSDPNDSATTGDHFFKEAKRLILENDEHEKPRLATVQALALMSVREAGCGREGKGWVYSGMSFRMASDLGLNVDSGTSTLDEQEIDARKITIWGCFLFDKCWSNYLGRQPQLPISSITVPKFDVFPMEDSETWSPYTDVGMGETHSQPSRTRTIALQISSLCEISADLLSYFYHPTYLEKRPGKQAELKKLSELHTRLEAWRKNLPKELEPKEGQLPNVLIMHMFFQLLFIHLFRPFLRYKQANSPLPSHVSPRRFCTHAAAIISKLLRLYKRTHGLRQIVNLAVYITHTACTIHLLNLPEKNAIRDLIHGLKHLEEIAEGWLCARKALSILHIVSRKWNIELPDEASRLLERTDTKFGTVQASNGFTSPRSENAIPASSSSSYSTVTTTQQHQPHARPHARPHPHPHRHLQHQPIANPSQPAPTFNLIASNGFFNTTATITPQSTPEVAAAHTPSSVITLPPQSAAELARKSRQQSFVLPQAQQELWNRHRASRGTAGDSRTSPSALFGGVDSLVEMEEGQDYWLQRDTGSFFENWNREGEGMEAAFNGNGNANVGVGYFMPGFGGLEGGYE